MEAVSAEILAVSSQIQSQCSRPWFSQLCVSNFLIGSKHSLSLTANIHAHSEQE